MGFAAEIESDEIESVSKWTTSRASLDALYQMNKPPPPLLFQEMKHQINPSK